MTAVHTFLDDYRTTFASFDADALMERFAYPVQVVSGTGDAAVVSLFGREEWRPVVDGLLGAYRALGVADGEPLEREIAEVTPQVASARVHWELRRGDGSAVYDFTAIYTVAEVDGALRIVALAHNELPKLGAAMAAAQSG